jgi:hypothetical protein
MPGSSSDASANGNRPSADGSGGAPRISLPKGGGPSPVSARHSPRDRSPGRPGGADRGRSPVRFGPRCGKIKPAFLGEGDVLREVRNAQIFDLRIL